MKVLVVEDQKDMNLLITKTLKKNNMVVDQAYDGKEALDYLAVSEYDIVILDVMMPIFNGYEVVGRLRNEGNEVPVLFLSAKDAIQDRVKGLDLGGDDYLIKPFDFDELLARIRVLTRKNNQHKSNIYTIDNLQVDIKTRRVYRGNIEIQLLPKEFTILAYMIQNQGIVLTREQLENQIWNLEYTGSSNNIDGYMYRLRKKIDTEGHCKLIHTIRGVGWVLRK